jgi:hypothetical protein
MAANVELRKPGGNEPFLLPEYPGSVTGAAVTSGTATILSGASLSDTVDCSTPSTRARRVVIPSNLRGVTILSAVECLTSGGTYSPVCNLDGSEWNISVTTSTSVPLDPALFDSCNYVKFRSGTAGQAQPTSGDLALTIIKG